MSVAKLARTPAHPRHRLSMKFVDSPGRVRRMGKHSDGSGLKSGLRLNPQVGQVSPAGLYAAMHDQPLRVVDQVEIVRNLLSGELSKMQNVIRFALQPDEDSVGGEILLCDFSQVRRFEIYQLESSISESYPAVSLEIVVRLAGQDS